MISVCIATFNGEKYIKQQIESILLQLGDKDEIIISDDHSTDNTISIIESFKDSRIKIFFNESQGVTSNFENSLLKSQGDLIFLSDQDDIWRKNKVSTFLRYFNNNKDIILYLSNLDIVDKKARITNKVFFNEDVAFNLFTQLRKNSFIGCAMAFRKELKKYILPFPKDIPMHDWWIGLCGILFSKVGFIEEKLLLYRRHDSNVTSGNRRCLKDIIKSRVILAFNLFQRYCKIKWEEK